jgi:CheY-like chemotaxis protein
MVTEHQSIAEPLTSWSGPTYRLGAWHFRCRRRTLLAAEKRRQFAPARRSIPRACSRGSQPFLLVDDDDVDVMTVRRGFQELKLPNPLHRVTDGEHALAFLRDPANPRPGVILLDLKMPRMGGIEFLKEREKDSTIKRIPVVVLTTSDAPTDRNAYFSPSCRSGPIPTSGLVAPGWVSQFRGS